jgi:hypothetical protein
MKRLLARPAPWVLAAALLGLAALAARAYALSCPDTFYLYDLEPVSVERLSGEGDLEVERARFLAPAQLQSDHEERVSARGEERVVLRTVDPDGDPYIELVFVREVSR